jgi:UDP-N-acetyl-2-amino-2-deoxyglucuronate dehydrogenase
LTGPKEKTYDVLLTYIASRGNWYHISWKGDERKSGGIATNIGVHFFDMLQWIFGKTRASHVHLYTHESAAGFIELERARVRWFMSVNAGTLPAHARNNGARTFRSLEIDSAEFDFSDGFEDLHTLSYQNILNGSGYSMEDARNAIQIVYDIRQTTRLSQDGERHPMVSTQFASDTIRRDIGW